MIKAVIFDLDGVLVDAREVHYEALNNSLSKFGFSINRDEHLSTYDGLPTKKKLQLLTESKGLSTDLHEQIWKGKQDETIKIINEMKHDERLIWVLKKLRDRGFKIAVCSNSIRESTKMMLLKKGFLEFVEFFLSNQDVVSPKPSPEMYLRAMVQLGLKPRDCLIVEDSHIGRQSAIDSGAHLCGVENTQEVTYEKINESIDEANKSNELAINKAKWQNKNMNIVMPMAGEGTSFKNAGHSFPKPLVDVGGKPMIQVAVENLNTEGHFIFIVKKEHYEKFNLKHLLNLIAPGCEIILSDGPTEGAACTVLLAKEHINNDHPLVIANFDQFIEWNSNEFFYAMSADECDGGLLTFQSIHPRWSYAKTGEDGFVSEVAEKVPISDRATVGIYYYKRGSDFVKYSEQMISKDLRFAGDFYVCPVYNEMIADKKKLRVFDVDKMWGLGTPEELNIFNSKYMGKI